MCSPCFVTSGAAAAGESDLSDEHELIGAVVGGHTEGGGASVYTTLLQGKCSRF